MSDDHAAACVRACEGVDVESCPKSYKQLIQDRIGCLACFRFSRRGGLSEKEQKEFDALKSCIKDGELEGKS